MFDIFAPTVPSTFVILCFPNGLSGCVKAREAKYQTDLSRLNDSTRARRLEIALKYGDSTIGSSLSTPTLAGTPTLTKGMWSRVVNPVDACDAQALY